MKIGLLDFVSFWGKCVISGFHAGQGTFGLFEGLCSFVAVALISFKAMRGFEKDYWKDRIMRMALRLAICTFFLSTFVFAPYQLYSEAQGKARIAPTDRPHITSAYSPVLKIAAGAYKNQIALWNDGQRPARELRCETAVSPAGFGENPEIKRWSSADDLAVRHEIRIPGGFSFHDHPEKLYFICHIKYGDPYTTNIYQQTLFLKWEGDEDSALPSMSIEERDDALTFLRAHSEFKSWNISEFSK
jgi:hypothetical protein